MKRLLIAALVGALACGFALTPQGRYLDRAAIDWLLQVRALVGTSPWTAATSPTAVVVIDEETHRSEPFARIPEVAWTPQLAAVLSAIGNGGARAIGVDLVYPKTLDVEELKPGYDRPLRRALAQLGRSGRLVLGRIDSSRQPILPEEGHVLAVGGEANVRPLQLVTDTDNVVREHAGLLPQDQGTLATTLVGELTRRAGVEPPERFLINYGTAVPDVPVYGLADLLRCAESGNAEFFARAFAGKTVLVGTALDVEDRHVPAKRFTGSLYNGPTERCTERPADLPVFGDAALRRTIPGVFIHADALNTLLLDRPLRMLPDAAAAFAIFGFVALTTLAFLTLPPAAGIAALPAALALALGAGIAAFARDVVLPLAVGGAAIVLSAGIVYLFRFIEELRARRRSEEAKRALSSRFGRYLAPAIIERLENDPDALKQGGERRWVTVFFSDIVGYTTVSERLQDSPERLVEIVNGYFTVMVDVIERHGGYVDKFIGDAVMAVWGAPLPQDGQEVKAVEAALACCSALERYNREVVVGRYNLPALGARVGVNTGWAIVGNMGSPQRLNYTVTGDTVNLASRLEGANKAYGTEIMIGPETAKGLGDSFVLRQLDLLVVKGKKRPVQVYEVLAPTQPQITKIVRAFNQAVGLYGRRMFEEAQAAFADLAAADAVASLYVERCRHFRAQPPPPDWDGSYEMHDK